MSGCFLFVTVLLVRARAASEVSPIFSQRPADQPKPLVDKVDAVVSNLLNSSFFFLFLHCAAFPPHPSAALLSSASFRLPVLCCRTLWLWSVAPFLAHCSCCEALALLLTSEVGCEQLSNAGQKTAGQPHANSAMAAQSARCALQSTFVRGLSSSSTVRAVCMDTVQPIRLLETSCSGL